MPPMRIIGGIWINVNEVTDLGDEERMVKFEFNMTKHSDQPNETVMKEIANWITSTASKPIIGDPSWFNSLPSWFRSSYLRYRVLPPVPMNKFLELASWKDRVRVAAIERGHPLWHLLDSDSQRIGKKNFLMWVGDPLSLFDDTVQVTHFGPVGSENDNKLHSDEDGFKKFYENVLQNAFADWSDRPFQDLSNSQKAEILAAMKEKIKFWLQKLWIEKWALRETKTDFLEEAGSEFDINLSQGLEKTGIALERFLAMYLKISAQQFAKAAAREFVKFSSRSALKKIPLAGFLIGCGFGAIQVFRGNPGRAVAEVASGTVSCVPGFGTIGSGCIDTAIAAKDFEDIKKKADEKLDQIKRVADELKDADQDFLKLKWAAITIDKALKSSEIDRNVDEFFKAITMVKWT